MPGHGSAVPLPAAGPPAEGPWEGAEEELPAPPPSQPAPGPFLVDASPLRASGCAAEELRAEAAEAEAGSQHDPEGELATTEDHVAVSFVEGERQHGDGAEGNVAGGMEGSLGLATPRTAQSFRRMANLADYPVCLTRTYKFTILLVALATTALSGTAECLRHTYARRARDAGESYESLADLETAVWSHWATWGAWGLYEVKSLLNCLSCGCVVLFVACFGLGCTVVRRRTLALAMAGSGLAYWGFQLAARAVGGHEDGRLLAKVLKSLSYFVACVGWFAVLPWLYRRVARQLARGCLFPLVLVNLVASLAALIANRVFNLWWPQLVLMAMKVLELIVAIYEQSFHDLGHVLALMSFFAAYPIALIWCWRQLEQQSFLGSTAQTLVVTVFTLIGKAHMYFIARGSVTHHQRSVVIFPLQFLEHFWTKCLLASTPAFSLDFIGASLVQSASLLLQSTQHGRQLARFILTPFLLRSVMLRVMLGEVLLLNQPAWKALMLIEHEVFRASHNVFADICATSAAGLLMFLQGLLVSRCGLEPAFALGQGSTPLFAAAWAYLLVLHVLIAYCASWSRAGYVARVKERFHTIEASGDAALEVDPVAYVTQSRALEPDEADGDGRRICHTLTPPSAPPSAMATRLRISGSFAFGKLPSGRSLPGASLLERSCGPVVRIFERMEEEGGSLERYIRDSCSGRFHARFEAFRELSPQRPALLMDPGTHASSFHNILFARFFGFFAVSAVFVITQTLYMIAVTADLIDD